jgi:serine/threonine protein kinase
MTALLGRHKLLAPEHLAKVVRESKVRTATPRALAKAVLRRGWLTVYQVNQLLAGHGHELVFGPYHVLDRLGKGGQSMVFKARHAAHGWLVALKVIRSELLACADARAQFLQEMEAMARLNHPNVVQFCDADQAGETFYCAMEYVEGTDLGKVVGLSGPVPVGQACQYVLQTALGLQHAHEHNLVHRDIKPVNLFLTTAPADASAPRGAEPEPLIKILDWGLASLRPPARGSAGLGAGNVTRGVIGTADYLSPEQALNAGQVDIRGDIYSLGCTFYFLLTGRPPFPDGTLVQKLMRHQQEEPVPLDVLRPDVPHPLAAIARRMMAKRREDRYQTPAAVALALVPFCLAGSAPAGPAPQPPPPRVPAEHRRGPDDTPMPDGARAAVPATRNSKLREAFRRSPGADSTCR